MSSRSLGAALAAVPLLVAPLPAQRSGGDTLALAQAVALARQASPRIAASAASVRAAGARISPAGTWPDPQLTLGVMDRSLSGMPDPMTMNQVTLMQMVPVNGVPGLRRRMARLDSAGAAATGTERVLEVERDVRARYWELYHVDQALAVMDRTLAVLRELASVAGAMYAVGTVPQSDVIRAQVALTRMQQEIEEMRLMRIRAAAELNVSLGREPDAAIAIPLQDPSHAHHAALQPLSTPPLPPLDSLAAYADSNSPRLAAARAMLESARVGHTMAGRMVIPDLSLGVSYGQRPYAPDDMGSVMVGVSLPLFSRRKQRDVAAAVSEGAEADVQAIRLELRAATLAARAEAETARLLLERVVGTLVPQAIASYEAALAAYRVGRADFAAVLDAQMALLGYQHDLHRYEAMYGAAVAEVDRLVGRPFAARSAARQEN